MFGIKDEDKLDVVLNAFEQVLKSYCYTATVVRIPLDFYCSIGPDFEARFTAWLEAEVPKIRNAITKSTGVAVEIEAESSLTMSQQKYQLVNQFTSGTEMRCVDLYLTIYRPVLTPCSVDEWKSQLCNAIQLKSLYSQFHNFRTGGCKIFDAAEADSGRLFVISNKISECYFEFEDLADCLFEYNLHLGEDNFWLLDSSQGQTAARVSCAFGDEHNKVELLYDRIKQGKEINDIINSELDFRYVL